MNSGLAPRLSARKITLLRASLLAVGEAMRQYAAFWNKSALGASRSVAVSRSTDLETGWPPTKLIPLPTMVLLLICINMSQAQVWFISIVLQNTTAASGGCGVLLYYSAPPSLPGKGVGGMGPDLTRKVWGNFYLLALAP